MMIDCEVTACSSTGDGLQILLQGKPPAAADWRALERQELRVPDNETTRRAFYVGRRVQLCVTLR